MKLAKCGSHLPPILEYAQPLRAHLDGHTPVDGAVTSADSGLNRVSCIQRGINSGRGCGLSSAYLLRGNQVDMPLIRSFGPCNSTLPSSQARARGRSPIKIFTSVSRLV